MNVMAGYLSLGGEKHIVGVAAIECMMSEMQIFLVVCWSICIIYILPNYF